MEEKKSLPPTWKKAAAGFAAIAALATLILACRAIGTYLYRRQEGNRLFAAGNYVEAKALYLQTGNDKMAALCDDYALEQQYLNGRRSLQSGDYERARALLLEIRGYKDAENLLLACDYTEAGALRAKGELEKAKEIYLDLGDYPGVVDRIRELNEELYAYSLELADAFELEHAVKLWTDLGDLKDCAARRSLGEKMIGWLNDKQAQRLTDPANAFTNDNARKAYQIGDAAYLYVPDKCNKDTGFLLYYPGGYDQELYIDFFYYFLMNPPPNTIALFLTRNGVNHSVEEKNREGIELLLRAGAECGVFMKAPTVVGSSLGAYPALYSGLYTWKDFGLKVPAIMTLDAGNNWQQPDQMMSVPELRELGEIHPDIYLFDNPGLGLDREGIRQMLETGNPVSMVDGYFDEHDKMTYDAMGMGVLHWMVGDRMTPCDMEIYIFRRLSE